MFTQIQLARSRPILAHVTPGHACACLHDLTIVIHESPIIGETRRLLSLYATDVPEVKRWVILSLTAPEGVSSSEIENAIHGLPLNLDAIHSTSNHI